MRRGHPNVHQHEVGRLLTNKREQPCAVAGLAHDNKMGALEETRESLAQEHVIVGQDDPRAVSATI